MRPAIVAAMADPLVLQVMKGDPTVLTWIDLTGVSDDMPPAEADEFVHRSITVGDLEAIPMPFETTALVYGREADHPEMFFAVQRIGNDIGVSSITLYNNKYCWARFRGARFGYSHPDGTGVQQSVHCISMARVALSFLYWLSTQAPQAAAFTCTQNKAVNDKRTRKGKRPLYEWKTVSIKPSVHSNVDRGGTHASPKPHERRGHMRTYKSGKQVFVKAMTINKHKIGTDGFVFHDYTMKD